MLFRSTAKPSQGRGGRPQRREVSFFWEVGEGGMGGIGSALSGSGLGWDGWMMMGSMCVRPAVVLGVWEL